MTAPLVLCSIALGRTLPVKLLQAAQESLALTFRLFFCAVSPRGLVIKTSGTLSFEADFVEFFGKICLSF